ncbi:MAG: LytTR family DNA-binding domain-containing protein [Saprospiraceae bacterium]|nr:LytTR family DNA-binding domain-containing protein [Saprospiraceae bacterium]
MPDKVRAIIIDDEERARRTLHTLLTSFCEGVEVIEQCASVPDGVLAINKLKPQLVFLDIEMPNYNGFDLLNFFRDIDFEIIFVTAYNEYAQRAFEVAAIDYLLKPVDIDLLQAAVEKAHRSLQASNMEQRLNLLKEQFETQSLDFRRIALPISDGLVFVDIDKIVVVKAEGAYSHVWLSDGTKLFVSKKLIFFERILERHPIFSRVHRSFLINYNYVKFYNKSQGLISMDNKIDIPVPKDKRKQIDEELKQIRVGG